MVWHVLGACGGECFKSAHANKQRPVHCPSAAATQQPPALAHTARQPGQACIPVSRGWRPWFLAHSRAPAPATLWQSHTDLPPNAPKCTHIRRAWRAGHGVWGGRAHTPSSTAPGQLRQWGSTKSTPHNRRHADLQQPPGGGQRAFPPPTQGTTPRPFTHHRHLPTTPSSRARRYVGDSTTSVPHTTPTRAVKSAARPQPIRGLCSANKPHIFSTSSRVTSDNAPAWPGPSGG
jgi:hypothetical protein